MSFPDEIKTRLIAQGITSAVAPIFVGVKPTLPETGSVVTLREYPGAAPILIHNTGAAPHYVRPSLQIVAHAFNSVDARALAYQAYNALSFVNTTLGTTRYIIVGPKQEPYPLGLDSKGRVQYAFNVETYKTPS